MSERVYAKAEVEHVASAAYTAGQGGRNGDSVIEGTLRQLDDPAARHFYGLPDPPNSYELIPGTALREENLAVWFTPSAIVDAFDGEESELAEWVRNASEAQLASIGEACLSADSLWRLFHELIEMFAVEDMEAEARAANPSEAQQ